MSPLTESTIQPEVAMSRQRIIRSISFLSIVLILAGCTTLVSDSVTTPGWKESKGVSYFLPRQDVQIIFTNQTIPRQVKAAEAGVKAAELALASAEKTLKAAKAALAKVDPKKSKPDPALVKAANDAESLKTATEAKLAKAKAVLAEATTPKKRVQVEVLPPVADTSKQFVARLSHSWLRDDEVTVKTSASGLLESVTVRSDDRTGDVLENVAKAVIEVAKAYARAGMLRESRDRTRASGDDYYYEFVVDPSNDEAIANINLVILSLRDLPYLVRVRSNPANGAADCRDCGSFSGIAYRRPVPYTIDIIASQTQRSAIHTALIGVAAADQPRTLIAEMKRLEHQFATIQSRQVELASGGPIAALPLPAGAFVETKYSATFSAGTLTEAKQERPSEAFGASESILNIATAVGEAVTSIITEILPLKIQYTKDQTELVNAESEFLTALDEKTKLEKALSEQTTSVADAINVDTAP